MRKILYFLAIFPVCKTFGFNNLANLPKALPMIAKKFNHFILISPPGSGKGEFSQYCVKKHGYEHIGLGNIFRNLIEQKTTLGKKIQFIYESPDSTEITEFIDQIAYKLIINKMTQALKQNKRFILDGFPRTVNSFKLLDKFFKENNIIEEICILELIANNEACLQRILGRRICPKCQAIYNIFLPNFKQHCYCGSKLITRKDDNIEFAKNRLSFFHKEIKPITNIFNKSYNSIKIDTQNRSLQELKETYKQLFCA